VRADTMTTDSRPERQAATKVFSDRTGRWLFGELECNHERRATTASVCAYTHQQRVVARVDDAGERNAAFVTRKAIALETTGVDIRRVAPAEREPGTARGARDDLRAGLTDNNLGIGRRSCLVQ
jgi:hypothetical protein